MSPSTKPRDDLFEVLNHFLGNIPSQELFRNAFSFVDILHVMVRVLILQDVIFPILEVACSVIVILAVWRFLAFELP